MFWLAESVQMIDNPEASISITMDRWKISNVLICCRLFFMLLAEVKKEDTSLQQKLLRDKLTSSKKDTEVLPKDPTSPLRSVKSFGALNL